MSEKKLKGEYPFNFFRTDYLKARLRDDQSKLALLEKDFQEAEHLVLVYSTVPFYVFYTDTKIKKALLSRIQSDELFYSTELVQIEGTKDIFDYHDGVAGVELGSRIDVQRIEQKYPTKKLFEDFGRYAS